MAKSGPSPFALGFAPLVLRVVLGLIIGWAGLAKWFGTTPLKSDDAAALTALGIIEKPSAPSPGAAATDATECRVMWLTALRVHKATHPDPDPATGKSPGSIWPKVIGEGSWPKWIAIGVLAAYLGGGLCLLIGLLTRLSAFAVFLAMLGAIWIGHVGPAIQSGTATLGFLPTFPAWDLNAWRPLIWQVMLAAIALSLMCLGSGALAVDRVISGYRASRNTPPPPAKGDARG